MRAPGPREARLVRDVDVGTPARRAHRAIGSNTPTLSSTRDGAPPRRAPSRNLLGGSAREPCRSVARRRAAGPSPGSGPSASATSAGSAAGVRKAAARRTIVLRRDTGGGFVDMRKAAPIVSSRRLGVGRRTTEPRELEGALWTFGFALLRFGADSLEKRRGRCRARPWRQCFRRRSLPG